MPGSVVANLIVSELRLGPAVCTNPAQSRLAFPVSSVLLALAPSANRVEAPVVLFVVVTAVCLLRRFIMVATVVLYGTLGLSFSVVSSSSTGCYLCPLLFPVFMSSARSGSFLELVTSLLLYCVTFALSMPLSGRNTDVSIVLAIYNRIRWLCV